MAVFQVREVRAKIPASGLSVSCDDYLFFFAIAQKISNVETCCIKPMGHLATTFPGRAKKNEKMELR